MESVDERITYRSDSHGCMMSHMHVFVLGKYTLECLGVFLTLCINFVQWDPWALLSHRPTDLEADTTATVRALCSWAHLLLLSLQFLMCKMRIINVSHRWLWRLGEIIYRQHRDHLGADHVGSVVKATHCYLDLHCTSMNFWILKASLSLLVVSLNSLCLKKTKQSQNWCN